MDLNYLFSRHQLSLVRATTAPSSAARHSHRGLAGGYAARIGDFQRGVGASFTSVRAAGR